MVDLQKEIFRELDLQSSGVIKINDFRAGIISWKTNQIMPQDVDLLIRKIGSASGIKYTDWIIATTDWQTIFEETDLLKQAFSYLDQDQDGLITSNDLYRSINYNIELNTAN